VGKDDLICDTESARILADGIAGARLAVISEAGHFPWVEQPLAFRAELNAFLSEIPPAE
jgi:pimeloyl-ACP methyl ester carboxylesterase